jgi:hypothetical protein
MRKSDLRSLAGGILVATLVLSPFILFGDDESEADLGEEESKIEQVDHIEEKGIEDEVTEEDFQAYIEAKGLFIVSESEYDSLNEDTSDYETVKSELEEVKKELEEEREVAKEQEESTSEGEMVYQLYLVIGSGMSSGEIAILLEDSNVVDDAGDFRQYIEEEDLVMSIKAGNYMLDSSMSVEEIADKIT